MKVRQTKEVFPTSVLVVDGDRLAGQAQEAQLPEVVKIAGVLEGCNTVAKKQPLFISSVCPEPVLANDRCLNETIENIV